MTGKEHTNPTGARKGARAQSQPTSPAAKLQAPAATPKTSEQPARGGGAASPEGASPFRLELPVVIEHVIGLNPAALPPHRVKSKTAVRGMEICESFFWLVQQLGNMAEGDAWVYSSSDLHEALNCLGEVGRAVAAGASDQAQYLEHVAERLYGREGGRDHDQT